MEILPVGLAIPLDIRFKPFLCESWINVVLYASPYRNPFLVAKEILTEHHQEPTVWTTLAAPCVVAGVPQPPRLSRPSRQASVCVFSSTSDELLRMRSFNANIRSCSTEKEPRSGCWPTVATDAVRPVFAIRSRRHSRLHVWDSCSEQRDSSETRSTRRGLAKHRCGVRELSTTYW